MRASLPALPATTANHNNKKSDNAPTCVGGYSGSHNEWQQYGNAMENIIRSGTSCNNNNPHGGMTMFSVRQKQPTYPQRQRPRLPYLPTEYSVGRTVFPPDYSNIVVGLLIETVAIVGSFLLSTQIRLFVCMRIYFDVCPLKRIITVVQIPFTMRIHTYMSIRYSYIT